MTVLPAWSAAFAADLTRVRALPFPGAVVISATRPGYISPR